VRTFEPNFFAIKFRTQLWVLAHVEEGFDSTDTRLFDLDTVVALYQISQDLCVESGVRGPFVHRLVHGGIHIAIRWFVVVVTRVLFTHIYGVRNGLDTPLGLVFVVLFDGEGDRDLSRRPPRTSLRPEAVRLRASSLTKSNHTWGLRRCMSQSPTYREEPSTALHASAWFDGRV
jgi:hypothetical protein